MDKKLLELLVCPITKTGLVYNSNTNELISERAKLAYPIKNNIPIMTADFARKLNNDEVIKLKTCN